MKDKFCHYSDLQKEYREGIDYSINLQNRKSKIIIFTPHGGSIERGTSEITRAIADEDFSYYIFESLLIHAKDAKVLHITSTRFNEPYCLSIVSQHSQSIAIHGCEGKEPVIFIGGKDHALRNLLRNRLLALGYPISGDSNKYPGTHSSNICNKTKTGMGVQFEISNGFRFLLFTDWRTRKGRHEPTDLFTKFISDIRSLIILRQNGDL